MMILCHLKSKSFQFLVMTDSHIHKIVWEAEGTDVQSPLYLTPCPFLVPCALHVKQTQAFEIARGWAGTGELGGSLLQLLRLRQICVCRA